MSDYAAQFQRSYLNPPPRGHPANRMQVQPPAHSYTYNPAYNAYTNTSSVRPPQSGYAPRYDYYNPPMHMQHYSQPEIQPSGKGRIAGDIHRQWNYAAASAGASSQRKATDPLPPVPSHLQGVVSPSRYPYSVSSAHSTPIKHTQYHQSRNPTTSHPPQYNPVHRSKSLAVPRPKVNTFPRAERSNTPPLNTSTLSDRGLTSWGRTATADLDNFDLPKSLNFNNNAPNNSTKPPQVEKRDLTLADILVESVPVKKDNGDAQLPPDHARRRSSDDILDSAKYIQEDKPIDEYVTLTGTRKKMKSRRVSNPFTGLLPGKSISADQLDAPLDGLQGGLRSREESIERLRGSHNDSDSAFTSKLDQQQLPSPTSSEEELRDISGFRGGVAVKRSRSLSSGTHRGPKESSFSPRHARVKILANNMSSSVDSTLERKQQEPDPKQTNKSYTSKYQTASPVYAYVAKKSERIAAAEVKHQQDTKSTPDSEKRPQPSSIDPIAIRHALIQELKVGKFNIAPVMGEIEAQYAVVKKTPKEVSDDYNGLPLHRKTDPKREKVSTKKSDPGMTYKPFEKVTGGDTCVAGIHAARAGNLDTLKTLLMSEHIDAPHSIDKRSAIHKNFYTFRDDTTESNLIHILSESGAATCLKWLVFFAPEGACVALNKDRLVPAILAIRKCSLECVKILVVDAHVPLTIQELGNETLLHHAAFIGQSEILKWLLEHMKEVQDDVIKDSDLQDAFGVTPAHFAAQQGFLDCLQVLQDAMCNLWCLDQHNQTPMDWAVAAKQELAANYLFLVRFYRYLSEQLSLEKRHSLRLQEKIAFAEQTNSKLKEDYEEQINVVKEEYDTRRKGLQQDFLLMNERILKEGKGGKPKRRRGVFRTFSLPAKQAYKKPFLQTDLSTEESSPDEPRFGAKIFPHTSNPDLVQPDPENLPPLTDDLPIDSRNNEEMLSTIEEMSHRNSVIQPPEEVIQKIDTIHEITIAENSTTDLQNDEISAVTDVNTETTPTLQKLQGETKTPYRSSPDPFLTEGSSSYTTPDNTLRRKKRTLRGVKPSSKTSLKDDTVSGKSTESSIPSRVGESTSCHDHLATTLKRIFSPRSRRQQPPLDRIQIEHPTQSDQVTLQTVEHRLSSNLIETDYIAESEYSSHASISVMVPHRAAPDPPPSKYDRKSSYVNATAVQESMRQFAITQQTQPSFQHRDARPYTNESANAYQANLKHPQYPPTQSAYNQQQQQQHAASKRQSYPGVAPDSQNKLNKLEPYSRQAERLLDSGYLGQSSDSLDAIRHRQKQPPGTLATNRSVQAYSAPTPHGYFSLPSTPQKMSTHRNVSWPNTTYSPQRPATVNVPTQYQQTQYSRPGYSTHKSTKISDL